VAGDAERTVTGLVVTADVLQEGAEAVLHMVLHDAAHLLNWSEGVQDTTMRGVYHNHSFVIAAEKVGLEWADGAERTNAHGYAGETISAAARRRHLPDLKELEQSIPLILPHLELPTSSSAGRTDRLTLRCSCDPPRSFRISRTIAAAGPINCGVCGKPFTAR
jgi:hypothetical protein